MKFLLWPIVNMTATFFNGMMACYFYQRYDMTFLLAIGGGILGGVGSIYGAYEAGRLAAERGK